MLDFEDGDYSEKHPCARDEFTEVWCTGIACPACYYPPHMGGCQNYGPLLGTLNIRGRTIMGTQKETNHPYPHTDYSHCGRHTIMEIVLVFGGWRWNCDELLSAGPKLSNTAQLLCSSSGLYLKDRKEAYAGCMRNII